MSFTSIIDKIFPKKNTRSRSGLTARQMTISYTLPSKFKVGSLLAGFIEIKKVIDINDLFIDFLIFNKKTKEPAMLRILQEAFQNDELFNNNIRNEFLKLTALSKNYYIHKIKSIHNIENLTCIEMEYIANDNYDELNLLSYSEAYDLSLQKIFSSAIQICAGMEILNSNGITLHGDLRLENILLTQDGLLQITNSCILNALKSPERVYGIINYNEYSKIYYQNYDGFGYGDFNYMAPEKYYISDKCDTRSDIFSFGVMLFYLCNKQYPFKLSTDTINTKETFQKLWKSNYEKINTQTPAKTGNPLFPIITHCLEKKVQERYQTFSGIKKDLETLYKNEFDKEYIPHDEKFLESSLLNNRGKGFYLTENYSQCIDYFNTALSLNSENLSAQVNKAMYLIKSNLFNDALLALESALEYDLHSSQIWFLKGISLQKTGRFEESIRSYNRVIEISGENSTVLKNKAISLIEIDRFEESKKILNDALKLDPDDAEIWFIKGNTDLGMNEYENAISYYNKCIELEPGNLKALIKTGDAYALLKNTDEAFKYWNQVLKLNSKIPEIWISLGLNLFERGLFPEAIKHYDEAIKHDEFNTEAWFLRGKSFFELEKYEESVRNYDKTLNHKPWYTDALIEKARALIEIGNETEAINLLNTAVEIAPFRESLWLKRGELLLKMEKYEDSFFSFEKALEKNPKNPVALFKKAICLNKLGKYLDAIINFKKVLNINPKDTRAMQGIGDSLQSLSKYLTAISYYNKIIKIEPANHQAWCSKGDAFRWLDKNKKAIPAYKKALEIRANDINTWLKLGLTYTNLKETRPAIESFDKALELNPNNLAALFHKADLERILHNKQTALNIYKKYLEIAYSKNIKNKYFYEVLSNVEELEREIRSV
jgi:tetratricopeptide (TPR) repeat protein